MKSFWLALSAIIVLIILVIVNGIYISNVTRNLEKMANELMPNDENAISLLEEYWKKQEGMICFAVSHNDVDEVNIAIDVLLEKCRSGEADGFYEYKARLVNSIIEIRNKERVHIHNIV